MLSPNFCTGAPALSSTVSNRFAIGVFSGSPSRHVYKSTDGASTWTSITGNLPDIPVTAMVIDPTAPTTTIMIGTDLGVYITRDGGATWTPFNNGLPLTAIHDLKYNASTGALVAATHGRGVWRAFACFKRGLETCVRRVHGGTFSAHRPCGDHARDQGRQMFAWATITFSAGHVFVPRGIFGTRRND